MVETWRRWTMASKTFEQCVKLCWLRMFSPHSAGSWKASCERCAKKHQEDLIEGLWEEKEKLSTAQWVAWHCFILMCFRNIRLTRLDCFVGSECTECYCLQVYTESLLEQELFVENCSDCDVFSWHGRLPCRYGRLACFRDDIIFFIYIYQRWKSYPRIGSSFHVLSKISDSDCFSPKLPFFLAVSLFLSNSSDATKASTVTVTIGNHQNNPNHIFIRKTCVVYF